MNNLYDKIIAAGKHADGKYIQNREYIRGNDYQIYYKGLFHICECDSKEMADFITNALNASVESYEYTINK